LATWLFSRKVRLELDASGQIVVGARSKKPREKDWALIREVEPIFKLYLAEGATAEPELICDAYEAERKVWRDSGGVGAGPQFRGFAARWVPAQPDYLLSKKGMQKREAVLAAMAILRTPPAPGPEPTTTVPVPPPATVVRPTAQVAPVTKSVPKTPVTETRHASGVFFRVRGRP
jgi:hypothetical protein